jgi:hypothetical protein
LLYLCGKIIAPHSGGKGVLRGGIRRIRLSGALKARTKEERRKSMKKVLSTIAVSTALVMGGAVAASAAGIEMDGSVRVRGLSEQGMRENSSTTNIYDQQVRLGALSKVSDDLTGYIQLETGTNETDGSRNVDTYTWGDQRDSGLFRGGNQPLNGQLGIIQAWMDYKPGTFGLKLGRQPFSLGTKQFFNHDNNGDDAIQLYGTLAGTKVQGFAVKLQEGANNDNSDDLDAYALQLNRKFSDALAVGLNYTFLKGGSDQGGEPVTAGRSAHNGLELSNLAADVKFTIGSLTLLGDINYQMGVAFRDESIPGSHMDAKGYAFQVGADYKLGSSTVGLLFAQGSGQEQGETEDMDAFINFLGDSPYQVYIPGYRVVTPGSFHQVIGQGNGANSGLSNLTLYQLKANTAMKCPLTGKDLAIRGALSYMETTEDFNNEDEIGTEIDLIAAWKLTSNLTYQVELAYLFTGDVYKANANEDPEDAYFFRHGLSMKF